MVQYHQHPSRHLNRGKGLVNINRKQTFLLLSCLLNIIGIWIALGIQLRYDYQQTRSTSELNVYNLSRAFEEHAYAKVRELDRLIQNLRSEYDESFSSFVKARNIIENIGYDDVEVQIQIVNRLGLLAYNDNSRSANTLDLSGREYFRVLRNSKSDSLFISSPETDPASHEQFIHFARKLIHKDGSFDGALVISVPTAHFSDFFQSVDIGPKGAITLFDLNRSILAQAFGYTTKVPPTNQSIADDHPFFLSKQQSGVLTSTNDADRVSRLSAFRKLQDYPLIVQVGFAEEDIYKPLNSRRNSIVIIGTIVTLALFGALAILLLFERKQQALSDRIVHREEQLKETLAELEVLVTTDPLTGLPNRRSFFSRAQAEFIRATRYNRPLSLVMVDVDHFKEVNDRFGHLVGDAALRHIAGIMKLCVREADMVARYGGEEFVIILPETDSEGAGFIAERVRNEIETSDFSIDQHGTIRLTVSLGIACMNSGNEYSDLDKLLQSADDAMYRAKKSGRNRVSYSTDFVNMEFALGADSL